jgi:hypothetical protein
LFEKKGRGPVVVYLFGVHVKLVTRDCLLADRDPVSTLHDLPRTISRHLFVSFHVPVVIAAALSEDIYQVEHLLKNV